MFPFRFDASPDELLGAIDHLQEVVACVRRDAGSCVTPEHERMLHALTRRLRTLVGDDAMALAGDVRDAALRALEAGNPAAALVTLELAYCSLRGLLNRLAGFGMPRAA